ncbi:MAG: zinc ABC transporter substrate-binding protein [Candidatus Accumulibacter sp.]|jgi:zinc/manganese transport system substrate-binding protein|nr:zinc ABC transporter substrate-binding protein [Accumulibacter sp.]
MRKCVEIALFMLMAALAPAAEGAVKVFATVPEWGALAREIGGERVEVFVATNGLQDPHRIQAKPSLIAKARSADIIVANGAELEIGWLPLVIQNSGNPRIQTGQTGYFEAARHVALLETPAIIDRSQGDVHPAGNPHVHGDPRNTLYVGEALSGRLARIDPENASAYREAYRKFAEKMRKAIAAWEKAALPLKNVPVLVQHKAFSYLESWLGLIENGALEPLPGIEPSSAHLSEIAARQAVNPARMVIYPSYQYDAPSRWISERAKIPVVMLPSTVGGTDESGDLFMFYEDTIRRLLKGLEG